MPRNIDGENLVEELFGLDDDFPIPEELAPYISLEKLKQNRQNYPEWQRELDGKEREQVKMIMERLLRLPLVHCSRNDDLETVTSHRQSSEQAVQANTYPLDQSLGLDNYAFLTWGIGDWSQYGQHLYCFDSNILFEPGTIVTPSDVAFAARRKSKTPFYQLDDELKDRVQTRYFDQMLTGRDWFYVIAIRILEELESGEKIIPIDYSVYGEIKVFSGVPQVPIEVFHGRREIEYGDSQSGKLGYYDKYLYPNGFAFFNIHHHMWQVEEGQKVNSVDPLPSLEAWNSFKHSWDEVMQ